MAGVATPSLDRLTPTDELAEWQDSCGTDEHECVGNTPTNGSAVTDSELCATAAKDDDTLVSTAVHRCHENA